VKPTIYTVLCPFGGSGGGALGFLDAEVRLLGRVGRFRCLGSIDFDAQACADFEHLTGSRALVADVTTLSGADIRREFGERAPHVVFLSPPCKGASRLIGAAKADTQHYRDMNRLAVVWMAAMLDAWSSSPPALVLLENVPGLPQRAGGMLRELRAMLRAHGYVFTADSHDCGEIGGLAQHRRRYLLVARHPKKCPPLLYQPPKRRVRGCGEVIGTLPMPATPGAAQWGALHEMPKLSWKNWLRLALIPAGGDWRDLEGVLREGQARRDVFRRHAVAAWAEPMDAVTGPGGHSVEAVADPRVALTCSPRAGAYGVTGWDDPSKVVTGSMNIDNAPAAVADPRIGLPDGTDYHGGVYGVVGWQEPTGAICGESSPSNGRFSVADPRVSTGYDAAYGVLGWDQPARTIAGTTAAGCGAYAVADPRERSGVNARLLTLDEALALDLDADKRPPFVPIIIAADGTWHRPMTLLELAALQGYPTHVRGEPLRFVGTRTQVAEHIGNSVPVGAAAAIATQMLVALVQADAETWSLGSGGGAVWVDRERTVEHGQGL
jgi:site-specific DNA-cytosine methylase